MEISSLTSFLGVKIINSNNAWSILKLNNPKSHFDCILRKIQDFSPLLLLTHLATIDAALSFHPAGFINRWHCALELFFSFHRVKKTWMSGISFLKSCWRFYFKSFDKEFLKRLSSTQRYFVRRITAEIGEALSTVY